MKQRFVTWWHDWRDSLWFLPAVITIIAALLAFSLVRLDRYLDIDPTSDDVWFFGGGVEGTRGVLQAIAGSIITVTGTVFSITIVALQLASTQYSPRVLRTFTGDRGVQLVLGIFIGTFTYSLLVLRSVRGSSELEGEFVPTVAVTAAVGIALISIGALIYFINHVAQQIQVGSIMNRIAGDIDHILRRLQASDEHARKDLEVDAGMLPVGPAEHIHAVDSGYLLRVSPNPLDHLARVQAINVVIERHIGEFVLEGSHVATIRPVINVSDDLRETAAGVCIFGRERELDEDPAYGIGQLADIAIKALSPGINDPTTAINSIDRLGDVLLRADRIFGERKYRIVSSESVTIYVPLPVFERLVDVAFAQIRHYGAGDVVVTAHLISTLGTMAKLVRPAHRASLVREARRTLTDATTENQSEHERIRLLEAAEWLRADGTAEMI